MSLRGLLFESVTIYQREPAGRDEYGDVVDQEVPHAWQGLLAHQNAATEITAGAETESEIRKLILEPGAPIDGWSRVEVEGQSWEVTGPPWFVWNPRTQQPAYVSALVRAVT